MIEVITKREPLINASKFNQAFISLGLLPGFRIILCNHDDFQIDIDPTNNRKSANNENKPGLKPGRGSPPISANSKIFHKATIKTSACHLTGIPIFGIIFDGSADGKKPVFRILVIIDSGLLNDQNIIFFGYSDIL